MKHLVERTCTVVRARHETHERQSESSPSHKAESRPLEAFRDEPAYVLLGSPGSGKTEAFNHEAEHEGVERIRAGDFQDLDAKPEWRGKTLYIDGLDETRAGMFQGNTPLGAIRAKLQRLGCPRFRLSCREADWFGASDRERLKTVAPNGELKVLRLDPLSDQGILDILGRNLGHPDPQPFVDAARERGIDDLLRNPLNLKMLVAAVANGPWPRTRMETFDLACRKLVSEENLDHQIAWSGTANTRALLDAAGDLCASFLLTGKAGVTLPGTAADTDHPRLEHVSQGDQQLLRRVVGTNLFALPAEGRLIPAHRQLAEFLAARRLAELVAEGLPVRRLLALMTGLDGGIISEFRGLAAWLAALCQSARTEIIERDPLGAVLYGDVLQFSAREKRLLLRALKAETNRNPWLIAYASWDPPLANLVGQEMEEDIRQALGDPARDVAQQSLVHLILEAIRAAEPLPGLADPLMGMVRDDSWPMDLRCAALQAYMRASQDDAEASATLRRLLEQVYTGEVATLHDDLLGILLTELYPDELPVRDLVGYLREPVRRGGGIRYQVFWTERLLEKSTIEQMVQLLVLLREPMDRVRAESGVVPRGVYFVVRPPIVLLRHLLERSPESVPQKELAYWLDFAGWLGGELRFSAPGLVRDAEFFGNWLSDHGEVQKAIIEHRVRRCRGDPGFWACMHYPARSFFDDARKPEDFGTWCADQALDANTDDVATWFVWEAAEFVHNAKSREQEARERIAATLSGDTRLSERFEGRLRALEDHDRFQNELHAPEVPPAPADGRFDEVRAIVRANLTSLRANQCPLSLLHHLAVAYLDGFSDVHGETPIERLRYLLGPDEDLVDAALAGLRGAIHRTDLPLWTAIPKLAAEERIHYLAYPIIVGLEELSRVERDDIRLTEAQTRLALSIHFSVARLRYPADSAHPPRWLRGCVAREPALVGRIWARCARALLGGGAQTLPVIHLLPNQPEYARLARAASIPLLEAFPVRCVVGQLSILRTLLRAAAAHGDRTRFLELIEAKLAYKSMNASQRVYWLTMGLFVNSAAYGERLESYVSEARRPENRIQRLVEMTDPDAIPHALRDLSDATALETLIRLIGPYSVTPPRTGRAYSVTWPIQANSSVHGFIARLSEGRSVAARNALESLAADDRLANWRSMLLDRLQQQKSLHREATFVHPSLEDVAEVLANRRPVNAADLWALTVDLLRQFSKEIRNGATSDWRQYWNVDKDNKAVKPKPENGCRDALLSDLRRELTPLGIDGVREGSYSDDKRADIRLSVPSFNVPIEIKRSCHDDWWSSIRTQLIAEYIPDPGTDGYGIYLVFWFGETEGCRRVPASGRKPKSPDDVRQALLGTLSDHERRKISVCVIDVSKPED